jgi:hypothetical protein
MQIFVLAYLPGIPNFFYIAVARATNKLSQAAAIVIAFAVLDVAAVVIAGLTDGIVGMAVADVAVVTLEAIITTPMVLRAARGLGRHRRTGLVETTSPVFVEAETQEQLVSSDGPWRGTPAREYQQLSALQLLMSMATPTTATMLAITGDSGLMPRLASNSQPTTGGKAEEEHQKL